MIKKDNTITKFQKHDKDTWSTEVQIALLTARIAHLTEHLKVHKKDIHSKIWLIKLTGQRKKLMAYLENKNKDAAVKLRAELWLRK